MAEADDLCISHFLRWLLITDQHIEIADKKKWQTLSANRKTNKMKVIFVASCIKYKNFFEITFDDIKEDFRFYNIY